MTLAAVLRARQRHQTGALGVAGQEGGKEQLLPGTITIAGNSYVCAVELSKIEYRMETATGLWKRWQVLTATVQKSLLVTAPEKKSEILFQAVKYQVDEVGGQNSTDLVWTLKADRKLPSPS